MSTKQQAMNLKHEMSKRRLAQATIKDLCILLKCRELGNYEPMFSTTLYTRHGGEYCEYLAMLG